MFFASAWILGFPVVFESLDSIGLALPLTVKSVFAVFCVWVFFMVLFFEVYVMCFSHFEVV